MSKEEKPPLFETVQCDICTHEWNAIFHPAERLECPNCGNMVMFEIKDNE